MQRSKDIGHAGRDPAVARVVVFELPLRAPNLYPEKYKFDLRPPTKTPHSLGSIFSSYRGKTKSNSPTPPHSSKISRYTRPSSPITSRIAGELSLLTCPTASLSSPPRSASSLSLLSLAGCASCLALMGRRVCVVDALVVDALPRGDRPCAVSFAGCGRTASQNAALAGCESAFLTPDGAFERCC